MKKENILLVLWIIFGFIFISAIDSILYLLVQLFYITLFELGVSFNILSVLVPIFTLILYLSTTLILINRIGLQSPRKGIYLTKFPVNLTVILGFIAIGLPLVINKLASVYSERAMEQTAESSSGFLNFYGWMHTGLGASQLIVITILFIYCIIKIRQTDFN